MNALLIHAEFPNTFWSLKHALKFMGKRCAYPPLGLITVAAMLPSDWDIRLIDTNLEPLTDADIEWADYALVSGMIVQGHSARQIIDRCKAKRVPVIGGGPLFSCAPQDFPDVDYLVLNEAEVTLPMFLEDLACGRPKCVYDSTEFADMSKSPLPRWDLLKMDQYAWMSIQLTRGCPFDCEFCNVTTMFGRKPRTKSAAQMVAELDALYTRGWRGGIFVVDDNLIGNKKALKTELLPALIHWQQGKRLPLHTEVSINLADDEPLMHLLGQACFDAVFIGIETPDEESLVECNKKQNQRRDLVAEIKKIHAYGLQVRGGFIVGFDHDPPTIFQQQIDLIQASGVCTAMVGLMQALPGTHLYKRMQREGRLLGESTGDNVDGTTNIRTKMDSEELKAGYKRIMEYIYQPSHYCVRLKTFLNDFRTPYGGAHVGLPEWKAFARSILYSGILGREQTDYWNIVVWTLVRRPKLFAVAITLWIFGYHCREVARLQLASCGIHYSPEQGDVSAAALPRQELAEELSLVSLTVSGGREKETAAVVSK